MEKNKIRNILRESLNDINEVRIPFNMNIPNDIVMISKIFRKNNYVCLIVGGAVRDALLGKSPKDYDLATDASPDKVEDMMRKNNIKTIPTGKAFGVINVFTNKGEYEVATFRKDLSGGRRPDAVEFTNIEGDVNRRDLTINALFYDIDKGEIVDLVGGVEDLKNGVVRTVGTPEDRFGEDRLRILRAIRFAGRFGSQLDPATDAALQKDASLDGVSGERIRDEFIKGIVSAKSVKHFIDLINKYGLFTTIFSGLNVDLSFFAHLNRNEPDYVVLIARILKKNNLDVLGKRLNDLKYPDNEIKVIKFLIALLSLNEENAVMLKKVQEHSGVTSDQIRNFGVNEGIPTQLLDAFEAFQLTVTGPEAMAKTGLKPGPELGKAIQQMEINNFKQILK